MAPDGHSLAENLSRSLFGLRFSLDSDVSVFCFLLMCLMCLYLFLGILKPDMRSQASYTAVKSPNLCGCSSLGPKTLNGT